MSPRTKKKAKEPDKKKEVGPVGIDRVHAALRREMLASYNVSVAGKNYKEFPSDSNAAAFQSAWKELRAAVDSLVGLDGPADFYHHTSAGDWVALASKWKDAKP